MIMETNMTNEKALDILERHNLWRRGADYVEATNPKLLGMAIDKAIEVLRLSIVSGSLPKDTDGCNINSVSNYFHCQREIESQSKCTNQCDHCKEYYKPLEQ